MSPITCAIEQVHRVTGPWAQAARFGLGEHLPLAIAPLVGHKPVLELADCLIARLYVWTLSGRLTSTAAARHLVGLFRPALEGYLEAKPDDEWFGVMLADRRWGSWARADTWHDLPAERPVGLLPQRAETMEIWDANGAADAILRSLAPDRAEAGPTVSTTISSPPAAHHAAGRGGSVRDHDADPDRRGTAE